MPGSTRNHLLWGFACALVMSLPASGQPVDVEKERERLTGLTLKAFKARDYAQAETILREWVQVEPHNFVPWYDLACALCHLGRPEEAAQMLQRAVVEGFNDFRHMTADPDLEPLRASEVYLALVEGWDRVIAAQADAGLSRVRKKYGDSYTYERDPAMHLVYASAFEGQSYDDARVEMRRLADWWEAEVTGSAEPVKSPEAGAEADAAPELPDADPVADETSPVGYAALSHDPWVLILLPNAKDYADWAQDRYGSGWERIGGSYMHDDKMLVAKDLGSSMRHEFWHVLHWRDMDRRSQRHPMWVMEGLCSLVEDVEAGPDGRLVALPSWRTNMSRRLMRSVGLMSWQTLFSLDRTKFMKYRPLAFYAQARTVFVYLNHRGKLRDWYAAYVRTFDEDPTGARAFEIVFERPLKQIEREYRLWVKDLEEVPEVLREGMASLPFQIEQGAGDGMTIVSVVIGQPRESGLKMKDVVTAINGHAIRDMNDYVRLLAEFEVGETVSVAYRRGDVHGTVNLNLVPYRPNVLGR